MPNMPDSNLMAAFATEPIYLAKLAGAPSRLSRMVEERMRPDDPPIDKTAALPWGGRLARMEESAELAWQAGCLLSKQAGIGSAIAGGVKDLAVQGVKMPMHGASALWHGTSAATKAKAGLIGGGLAVGGAVAGAGALAGKGVDAVSNFASVPEGEHVAHVMLSDELEKQALDIGGMASAAKGFLGGAGKSVSGLLGKSIKSVGTGVGKATGAVGAGVNKATGAIGNAFGSATKSVGNVLNPPVRDLSKLESIGVGRAAKANTAATKAKEWGQYKSDVGSAKAQNMFGGNVAAPVPQAKSVRKRLAGEEMKRRGSVEAPAQLGHTAAPNRAPMGATGRVMSPGAQGPQPAYVGTKQQRQTQLATSKAQAGPNLPTETVGTGGGANTPGMPAAPRPVVQPPPPAVAPTTGQVQKPPAAPPPPAIAPAAQQAPMQNMAAKPQQATQPTAAPPANPPPVGTVGQKGQQAAIQSGDAGAAVVQTPQEAGQGTIGKIRGALPWVGGALGAGALGIGAGAAMLGGKATKAMGQEGQFNNSYQGYGAPVAGSASQFGYVNPPGGR